MKPPPQLTTPRIGPVWERTVTHGEPWRFGFHVTRQQKPVTAFRGDAYRIRWWDYAVVFKLGHRRVIIWHFTEETN